MTKLGAFTFVLHSHIPYTRRAGRWPHGEEWLHEATAETYIPLLNELNQLMEEGIPVRLTLGLTPILLEQLADEDVQRNFSSYLEGKIIAADGDIPRFEDSGETHFAQLAKYYRDWYIEIRRSFVEKYEGNIVPAFRKLQDAGLIEVITCAATHGYLPLLSQDESIHLQLKVAVESYQRHMGRAPQAIWLPECAYRPGYITKDGHTREGIEVFLGKVDLKLFFAETHMIEGGRPVGVAAGEAIGPYGAVTRRYLVPVSDSAPGIQATTYKPYFVSQPDVAVIGRNNQIGLQVWSANQGYPGDHDYRDFHKKDGASGMQYWRVTGANVDLVEKDAYHPEWAQFKVEQHAEHFTRLVEGLLTDYHEKTNDFSIVSANYDTELFGHWWFEGVAWIASVLKKLALSEVVELTTASEFLDKHSPEIVLNLPEGSWGAGGAHFVWDNTDTRWMWPIIHQAEERMKQMVNEHVNADASIAMILNQAARELLLLQSSDWPFLVTTGQAKEYAIQRFEQHVERFNALYEMLRKPDPVITLAEDFWEKDKIFPEMDYRWYQA
jgi:1,4-alpha-glucan branching enzyme